MAATTTVTLRTAPPQCHRPVPTRQSWLCRNGRSPVLPSTNVSQSLHARHALHALLAPLRSATRQHQRWLDAEPRRRRRRHGMPVRAGVLGGIPIPVSLPGLRPLASALPLQPSALGPSGSRSDSGDPRPSPLLRAPGVPGSWTVSAWRRSRRVGGSVLEEWRLVGRSCFQRQSVRRARWMRK
jgi:hypothetical protein